MHTFHWPRLLLLAILPALPALAREELAMDTIKTSAGDLHMTFIGHASLMFTFNGKVIHIDPCSQLADYTRLPKADIILVTHEHPDHLDPSAIKTLRKPDTAVVVSRSCGNRIPGGLIMTNGEMNTVQGITIEAVPAYNIVHLRAPGMPYHPKGNGNGYVLTFGDKRVYVAGDTENTPELKILPDIDCAFLPMNLPYTMTPEMVADAARSLHPKILYPYHMGETDPSIIVGLLKDSGIDVRIRKLQ